MHLLPSVGTQAYGLMKTVKLAQSHETKNNFSYTYAIRLRTDACGMEYMSFHRYPCLLQKGYVTMIARHKLRKLSLSRQ